MRRGIEREACAHPVETELEFVTPVYPTESLVDLPKIIDLVDIAVAVAQARIAGDAEIRQAQGSALIGVGNAQLFCQLSEGRVGIDDCLHEPRVAHTEFVVLGGADGATETQHHLIPRSERLARITGSTAYCRRGQIAGIDGVGILF